MNIFITEGMLTKLKFRVKFINGGLNVTGYNKSHLGKEKCSTCLLKYLKKSDTLSTDDVLMSNNCTCISKISPEISLSFNNSDISMITIV